MKFSTLSMALLGIAAANPIVPLSMLDRLNMALWERQGAVPDVGAPASHAPSTENSPLSSPQDSDAPEMVPDSNLTGFEERHPIDYRPKEHFPDWPLPNSTTENIVVYTGTEPVIPHSSISDMGFWSEARTYVDKNSELYPTTSPSATITSTPPSPASSSISAPTTPPPGVVLINTFCQCSRNMPKTIQDPLLSVLFWGFHPSLSSTHTTVINNLRMNGMAFATPEPLAGS